MASRRQYSKDGCLIDRPTAYHATKAETSRTESGMADQGAIPGRTDRSLHTHGRSCGACHPPGKSRAEHAAPSPPTALIAPSQSWPCIKRKRIQTQQNIDLQIIVGAERYNLNDVIARDLCIKTVEDYIQHITRRMYDINDQGPHEFLRNIAPMPRGHRTADSSQENFSRCPPQQQGKAWSAKLTRDGTLWNPSLPRGPYPPGSVRAIYKLQQNWYIRCSRISASVAAVFRPPHMKL
ncbi:hypothetical protein EVAR_45261_1 [Eumeta japonica]|uniref:Uncharacterized protein n=1 Tax=Eumeta variegata TaxID=151549 RepID=A0A4C1XE39_EUMVA|nr:hypothetical protein EVAR_45261_1 [Eumeta japonica]